MPFCFSQVIVECPQRLLLRWDPKPAATAAAAARHTQRTEATVGHHEYLGEVTPFIFRTKTDPYSSLEVGVSFSTVSFLVLSRHSKKLCIFVKLRFESWDSCHVNPCWDWYKFRHTARPYPTKTQCHTVRAFVHTTDAASVAAASVMVALCGAVGSSGSRGGALDRGTGVTTTFLFL